MFYGYIQLEEQEVKNIVLLLFSFILHIFCIFSLPVTKLFWQTRTYLPLITYFESDELLISIYIFAHIFISINFWSLLSWHHFSFHWYFTTQHPIITTPQIFSYFQFTISSILYLAFSLSTTNSKTIVTERFFPYTSFYLFL